MALARCELCSTPKGTRLSYPHCHKRLPDSGRRVLCGATELGRRHFKTDRGEHEGLAGSASSRGRTSGCGRSSTRSSSATGQDAAGRIEARACGTDHGRIRGGGAELRLSALLTPKMSEMATRSEGCKVRQLVRDCRSDR